MRLWHEALLPFLPRAQLLGQHRECCALRGLAWGKKHAVVDYVFLHPREWLAAYHFLVMEEMAGRGYHCEDRWKNAGYRGRHCPAFDADAALVEERLRRRPVYTEHDGAYLQSCLDNLKDKGINIERGAVDGYEGQGRDSGGL